MIYICDNCHFYFERLGEIEECPDCGKYNIRAADDKEIEPHFQLVKEQENIIQGRDENTKNY